jgi:hypothetical protein
MKYFSALSHLWLQQQAEQPQSLPSKKVFSGLKIPIKDFLLDFKSYASG